MKNPTSEQKELKEMRHSCAYMNGFITCLFFLGAVFFLLGIMGYSEADNKGQCQGEGRNVLIRIVEQSMVYQIGCSLGRRL